MLEKLLPLLALVARLPMELEDLPWLACCAALADAELLEDADLLSYFEPEASCEKPELLLAFAAAEELFEFVELFEELLVFALLLV